MNHKQEQKFIEQKFIEQKSIEQELEYKRKINYFAHIYRNQGMSAIPKNDFEETERAVQMITMQECYAQLKTNALLKALLLDVKLLAMFGWKSKIVDSLEDLHGHENIELQAASIGVKIETPSHLTIDVLFQDVLGLITLVIKSSKLIQEKIENIQVGKIIDSFTDPTLLVKIIKIVSDLFCSRNST